MQIAIYPILKKTGKSYLEEISNWRRDNYWGTLWSRMKVFHSLHYFKALSEQQQETFRFVSKDNHSPAHFNSSRFPLLAADKLVFSSP
jgi:hypothetical protein